MKIGVATLKDRPTHLTATETPAELGLGPYDSLYRKFLEAQKPAP